MDLIGLSTLNGDTGSDEIEKLYDELDGSECECARAALLDSCNFHQKLTRLKDLHNREIEVIERGFLKLRSSISKTLPLLEEIDAGLDNVLK